MATSNDFTEYFNVLVVVIGLVGIILLMGMAVLHNSSDKNLLEIKASVEINQKLTKDLQVQMEKMTEEIKKLKK